MEFKFESSRQLQLETVESIVKLFDGQRHATSKLEFQLGACISAVSHNVVKQQEIVYGQ